jgi:hypothetical protein
MEVAANVRARQYAINIAYGLLLAVLERRLQGRHRNKYRSTRLSPFRGHRL